MALLTAAEYIAAFPTSLPTARVQDLLDAAENDIIAMAGTVTAQTLYAQGGYGALVLPRPLNGSFTSVTERADTTSALVLATNDYRVDGYMLIRLMTGTNPKLWWDGLVKVVHDPADQTAERKRAQMALVQLDVQQATGITSERVGDWAASYGQNSRGPTYAEQRQAILDSLAPVMVA